MKKDQYNESDLQSKFHALEQKFDLATDKIEQLEFDLSDFRIEHEELAGLCDQLTNERDDLQKKLNLLEELHDDMRKIF